MPLPATPPSLPVLAPKKRETEPWAPPPLSEADEARLKKKAKSLNTFHRKRYLRVVTGEIKSRTQAVKAFCAECVGYENVSASVRNCTARLCPLWLYRPYQADDSEEEDPPEEPSGI